MNEYPIIVDLHTQNDCYKAARIREKTHIIVHSTACKGPAYDPRWKQWNRPDFQKCAHYFVDWNGIYQNLPANYQGWLNGVRAGNDCSIAFEICEPLEKNDTPQMAADLYNKTLWLCYTLCVQFDIPPARVICHAEAHKLGLANNHGDVNHWWGKKGTSWEQYTMDRLRRDLAQALGVAETFPYVARVQTKKGGPINLWSLPGSNAQRVSLTPQGIPNGDLVVVTGYSSLNGWYTASYDGVSGNADGQYLRKTDLVLLPSEDDPAIVVPEDDDTEPLDGTEPITPGPGYILEITGYEEGPLTSEQAMNLMDELMGTGYVVQARAASVIG